MKIFKYSIFFILLLSLEACYYDKEDELYEYYNLHNNCNTVSTVKYSVHIQPIIKGNCAISGCHTAGGSGNGIFDNYAGIKAKVDNGSLRQRVVVDKSMPPSQALNNCQIQLINAWIDAAAPNN